MDITLNAEAIERALVEAITKSAVGKQIDAAITKIVSSAPGYNQRSLVEQAVFDALQTQVRFLVREEVEKKREDLRAKIAAKLLDEHLDNFLDKIIEKLTPS